MANNRKIRFIKPKSVIMLTTGYFCGLLCHNSFILDKMLMLGRKSKLNFLSLNRIFDILLQILS